MEKSRGRHSTAEEIACDGNDRQLIRAFRFRSLTEIIADRQGPQWLVRNWLETNSLSMFFGDAGSCKSWFLSALALHIAAGLPFFDKTVTQGPVFILAGEGHRNLGRRLSGLMKHYDIDSSVPLYISNSAASLTENESVADVLTEIQRLVDENVVVPALVIVDTVSRNFGPADENSTQDMAQFVRSCDWIRNEYSCAVILAHHVGHQDKTRARGNTTLRGALDSEYRVLRDEAGIIDVTCTKCKDFESPGSRRFLLTDVDIDWTDDEGFPVKSAALVLTEQEPIKQGKQGRGKNQTIALKILRDAYDRHRANLLAGGHDPAGALVSLQEWRDLCQEDGISRNRMREVENSLRNTGLIKIDGVHVLLSESYLDRPK